MLYHDGVHLTDPGNEILAGNIVYYINKLILWQDLPNNEENKRYSSEQGNDHLAMKYNNYSKKTFSRVSERIGLRSKDLNNPLINYLNISSKRNKIIGVGKIMSKAPLGIIYIGETKLDESFPDFQFHM